jgi:hypothetical protein
MMNDWNKELKDLLSEKTVKASRLKVGDVILATGKRVVGIGTNNTITTVRYPDGTSGKFYPNETLLVRR